MVEQALPSQRRCEYNVREVKREVCQDVEMLMFREVCEQALKMIPKVPLLICILSKD